MVGYGAAPAVKSIVVPIPAGVYAATITLDLAALPGDVRALIGMNLTIRAQVTTPANPMNIYGMIYDNTLVNNLMFTTEIQIDNAEGLVTRDVPFIHTSPIRTIAGARDTRIQAVITDVFGAGSITILAASITVYYV